MPMDGVQSQCRRVDRIEPNGVLVDVGDAVRATAAPGSSFMCSTEPPGTVISYGLIEASPMKMTL